MKLQGLARLLVLEDHVMWMEPSKFIEYLENIGPLESVYSTSLHIAHRDMCNITKIEKLLADKVSLSKGL